MKMEKEDERIGIFPSWSSLYWAVGLYTVSLVLLLYVLTRVFDYSTP